MTGTDKQDQNADRQKTIAKLRKDAQLARSVLGEQIRRIQVSWANGESFIVDVWRGRIVGVTGPHSEYLGEDEKDAASELRAVGASFTDVTGIVK